MDNGKLEHYKQLLLAELRVHARHVSEDQASAIELADDGAKESADLALRDLMSEMVLKLGDRESQMIADIDQALLRMEEGSYGRCTKCNQADRRAPAGGFADSPLRRVMSGSNRGWEWRSETDTLTN